MRSRLTPRYLRIMAAWLSAYWLPTLSYSSPRQRSSGPPTYASIVRHVDSLGRSTDPQRPAGYITGSTCGHRCAWTRGCSWSATRSDKGPGASAYSVKSRTPNPPCASPAPLSIHGFPEHRRSLACCRTTAWSWRARPIHVEFRLPPARAHALGRYGSVPL